MIQEHTGAVGTGATVGAGVIGWVADAMPLFQAFSLIVSALVGIATLVWYAFKFLDRAKAKPKGE